MCRHVQSGEGITGERPSSLSTGKVYVIQLASEVARPRTEVCRASAAKNGVQEKKPMKLLVSKAEDKSQEEKSGNVAVAASCTPSGS